MNQSKKLRINGDRLREEITTLASIGRDQDHGINRMAFSEGDRAAREWLQRRIEASGLEFHQDGAANLYGRLGWDGTTPSVLTGSHIDTVPGGGHLDGALGVLAGLEVLRTIAESGVRCKRPLEVAAFSDEEGRFGGMFGSQALAGLITPETIYNSVDLNGVTLLDAMAGLGLDALDALRARRRPESLHASVELHIEQGPVLDRERVAVGVVEAITGLFKWGVRLIGVPNHAGTTPMAMRRDALQGLAEFAGQIDRILEEHGSESSVATIGRVELHPGAPNTVPGQVDFSLDVRDPDPRILDELFDAFRRALSAIGRRRDLMFEFDVLSEIEPTQCDPAVVERIAATADELAIETRRMVSGAAHDTQSLARVTRAAMIFVPSKEGRSHSIAEWTDWEDIETGANLLLQTLLRLANE